MKALFLGILCASATGLLGQTEPTLTSNIAEVVAFGSKQTAKFTAVGGSTAPPPSGIGLGPWTKTGRCEYIWRVFVSASGEERDEKPHKLDGKITSVNVLEVPLDTPGGYAVSVILREEWKDSSVPPRFLFWPPVATGGPSRKAQKSE